MDSWPRVALLVDVGAAAELCERLDDSLLGCLQLVRELQSESGGKDVAFSYSLFDSSRDLDQTQLQAFTRQQSYRAHHHQQHARVKSDVVCMSSWQAWDMSAWAKFRKNVLAAVSLCGKDMESIASPVKRPAGHDENRANGNEAEPELPLICRCLSAVNTSGCKSSLYICIVGVFPSVDHVWREWAGIPRPAESVSAELITAQLSSHLQHTEPQWRFVECRPQSGVQAVLQASSAHGAVQLFACSATAKGLLYDQLCGQCFVAPPTTATQPAGAATIANSISSHASLQLSLNGYPGFACRGDWRPIRRKTLLQRLAMYSTVETSKLQHCCPQPLGKLLLDGSQLGAPMLSWVGTLHAANLVAIGVAVHEGSELPVWLLPVSATELQVALIRVGSGQTPLLINAIKQSTAFASNSTLLSLMRPPPHVAASLATTTKRAPLQPQPQLQQSESKMPKPRMSRGSSLLRRSDSVVSAAECDRSLLEEPDDVDEALQAIDAALGAENEAGAAGEEAETVVASAGPSETLNLLEHADFARELGSHIQAQLQDQVWATYADAMESCILRGQLHPLELAQTLATQAPMDKAAVRRVAEAISSLYQPIAKKFMARCTVAERALLARCSILQLLFLFESALAGKNPGKGKAQGMDLSKIARRHASHAIVKLATNLNAPGFESSKMLFAGASSSATNADLSSVQSVCSYLQQRYGDKLRAAVEEICSEVDDSYSKPRADLPSKLPPEQPAATAVAAVKGRPSKLRLLPEGGENSDDDDDRQSSLPPFLADDQDTRDSDCCSVLPAGSDTNMSDSISKVRKRLFEDAAPQSAPQTEVRSRRSYPPSSRTKLPAAAAEATSGQEPVKLQELISRSTVSARGGFAASRQQVGAYQVVMASKAAMQQSKLKRSHSLPARGRELLARSQAAAVAAAAAQIVQQSPPVENQQPSTVAETPLIKRRRS